MNSQMSHDKNDLLIVHNVQFHFWKYVYIVEININLNDFNPFQKTFSHYVNSTSIDLIQRIKLIQLFIACIKGRIPFDTPGGTFYKSRLQCFFRIERLVKICIEIDFKKNKGRHYICVSPRENDAYYIRIDYT